LSSVELTSKGESTTASSFAAAELEEEFEAAVWLRAAAAQARQQKAKRTEGFMEVVAGVEACA
jgi:hypothetical protein